MYLNAAQRVLTMLRDAQSRNLTTSFDDYVDLWSNLSIAEEQYAVLVKARKELQRSLEIDDEGYSLQEDNEYAAD